MNWLFVYGTLKRGHCRENFLHGQNFIGTADTDPDYRLFLLDGYPGLVAVTQASGQSIQGEIWQVDQACLQRLDVVEGVSEGAYIRRTIRIDKASLQLAPDFQSIRTILTTDEKWNSIEAYFYLRSTEGRVDCGSSFTS